MSMSKAKTPARPSTELRGRGKPPPRRKKTRISRDHLTHFEIRSGQTLRLRIPVADDALAEAGDELGALIKRISPSTRTPNARSVPDAEPDFIVSRDHFEHDASYHVELREHLSELFRSLCDAALEDALVIAQNEHGRRAEGSN